jgi:hypothetical protein
MPESSFFLRKAPIEIRFLLFTPIFQPLLRPYCTAFMTCGIVKSSLLNNTQFPYQPDSRGIFFLTSVFSTIFDNPIRRTAGSRDHTLCHNARKWHTLRNFSERMRQIVPKHFDPITLTL